MILSFTKMHGLGNDFMVVEALSRDVSLSTSQIRSLASRQTGIGFDQLLMIEPPTETNVDFNYRIFNADGGEVAQCGNGVRCLAKFLHDKKLCAKKEIRVSTMSSCMLIERLTNDDFRVDMGEPQFSPESLPFTTNQERDFYTLEHDHGNSEIAICSMGNPHAVIAVDDVDNAPVHELGPVIEAHPLFPDHVNVGFMQIVDRGNIRLRVYERGAGETAACGSGACAAAAVARRFDLVDDNVTVCLTGGELTIGWGGKGQHLLMTGPAATVYEGKIKL